jgi:GT2 family glycosyltransferase
VRHPSIAIVSAWQNHLELAPDYFAAVEAVAPDQLVIVDDGSDPALEFAAHRLDKPAGFCGANNVALALVETDHVLFLNNDVAPLRPDWLADIRKMIEPGVIVAPLRFDPQYCDVDGTIYPYADGWCLAMTTEDARRLGGWDETYDAAGPAYYSDTVFSFNARINGMRLREVRPGLLHKGGQTGGTDLERFNRALAANKELFADQVRKALA